MYLSVSAYLDNVKAVHLTTNVFIAIIDLHYYNIIKQLLPMETQPKINTTVSLIQKLDENNFQMKDLIVSLLLVYQIEHF